MPKELLGRVKEGVFSIGPFFLVLLILHFSGFFMMDSQITPDNVGSYVSVFDRGFYADYYAGYAFGPVTLCFLLAFLPLVLGMSLFGMGADQAMNKMGALVGTSLTKRKSLTLMGLTALLLGALVTLAEPDLSVFSEQLFGASGKWLMMAVVSVGVGLLLAIGLIRIVYQWDFRLVLFLLYLVVFGLGILVNRQEIFAVVFDASGTTTGAVSAPFILALGIGVAQTRGGKNAEDDSFGVSGLASVGPLISVMILAKVMPNMGFSVDAAEAVDSYGQLGGLYGSYAVSVLQDVALSMAPLVLFFFVYQFFFLKLPARELLKIGLGLVYTFLGLYVFLLGANTGFIPVARKMGLAFSTPAYAERFWLVMLVCLFMGLLIILAEPAVHVLGKQVEEVSRGTITSRELMVALCLALGAACVLGVAKIQYQIDFMAIVVPILIVVFFLACFVPELYTALAFDSSGIASGTMTSCFLLPMCIGLATGKFGADNPAAIVAYGTGILGLVSVTPLLAIILLGVYGRIKSMIAIRITRSRIREPEDSQVIHLPNAEPLSLAAPR